jgi:hypothetical protein
MFLVLFSLLPAPLSPSNPCTWEVQAHYLPPLLCVRSRRRWHLFGTYLLFFVTNTVSDVVVPCSSATAGHVPYDTSNIRFYRTHWDFAQEPSLQTRLSSLYVYGPTWSQYIDTVDPLLQFRALCALSRPSVLQRHSPLHGAHLQRSLIAAADLSHALRVSTPSCYQPYGNMGTLDNISSDKLRYLPIM